MVGKISKLTFMNKNQTTVFRSWKNVIWGRFNEVTQPTYEYAYLHAHTRAMQIWPDSTHIEDM